MSIKREISIMMLVCLVLLVIIPFTAAETVGDNQTVIADNAQDILTENNDYYFNSSASVDGDGSFENPYKYLKSDRIKDNSRLHFADGNMI